MKEVWKTPELIVLSRGKPEESVLSYCKQSLGADTSSGTGFRACAGDSSCTGCSKIGS